MVDRLLRSAKTIHLSRADLGLARDVARSIRDSYDRYCDDFLRLTRRARQRFEKRDWPGRHKDSLERLDLYEKALSRMEAGLERLLGVRETEEALWKGIKQQYSRLIKGRHDAELAETFFNSVTRKILWTVGLHREIEYFYLERPRGAARDGAEVYRRYPNAQSTSAIIKQILSDYRFRIKYENLDRDCELVGREIDLYLWPIVGYDGHIDAFEMIKAPFYRNKVAYIVGRIRTDNQIIPIVLPLYNGPTGIYVDTVLLRIEQVSRVFGFAHSYFHIEIERQDILIDFLKSILPHKPIAELYISIGCNKHGKTEFYRDLHHFVHESKENFIPAPGKEGAVMIVFTLPDYNYVFKVIKDRPCFLRSDDLTDKRISRSEVMACYDMVCHRDRVGRMVDTQEFENLRFRIKRFSRRLLSEFRQAAREVVTFEKEHVVIQHLYVQRRVRPLPMYLVDEKDPEAIRRIILDFGYFLKDLAASGIFPGDLFNMWNYGVTTRGRVVLFDYDDVAPLENTRFRVKPEPRDEFEELQPEEDRITATRDDFFMDEIERYSGIPLPLKGVFDAVHSDIYSVDFWRDMQRRVKQGEIFDITPYDRSKKFDPTRTVT